MRFGTEEPLEPMARWWRFRAGLAHIPKNNALTLVDLGCGPTLPFYTYAKRHRVILKKYIGIDPLLNDSTRQKHRSKPAVELHTSSFTARLDLPDSLADIVVSFASLEHVDHPAKMLQEAVRLLKPTGRAIFTTPSKKSKKILEFLSFTLGLISPREIAEHKNYFDSASLLELAQQTGVALEAEHHYFEFGLNNLLVLCRQ